MIAEILGGIIFLIFISAGLHQVDEGHVGVYWRGGALLSSITEPGYHLKLPFLTTFAQVETSVQTDKVTDIPCGTSGGVVITFEKIEVVNRLHADYTLDTIRKYSLNYDKIWIFDKIHHEINQFCSSHSLQEVYIDKFDTLDESLSSALQRDCDKWAPGIEIIATRVTKPRIPKQIARDYEAMEQEKTRLLIETQRQKVIEKEGGTERLVAMIQASKQADMSRIRMEKEVLQKKTHQTIQLLENEIYAAKHKAKADAEFYRASRLTLANNLKFTDSYLQYQLFQSIKERPKTYYGQSITDMYTVKLVSDLLPGLNISTAQKEIQTLLQEFETEISAAGKKVTTKDDGVKLEKE